MDLQGNIKFLVLWRYMKKLLVIYWCWKGTYFNAFNINRSILDVSIRLSINPYYKHILNNLNERNDKVDTLKDLLL